MAFTLQQVVPWGRSFDEYRQMFALTQEDMAGRILSCADGPASFNARATRFGVSVCSCDPLYRFTAKQIRERIAETYDTIIEQTRGNMGQFVWRDIQTIEQLGQARLSAMDQFLSDYSPGKAAGRYVAAALPALPFASYSFDLVLCSHFLFLYNAQLDLDFHVAAVAEMCRVAPECRIFPMVALNGERSPFVQPMRNAFRDRGCDVSIERVPYEFQRGGNEMMRIRRSGRKTELSAR